MKLFYGKLGKYNSKISKLNLFYFQHRNKILIDIIPNS